MTMGQDERTPYKNGRHAGVSLLRAMIQTRVVCEQAVSKSIGRTISSAIEVSKEDHVIEIQLIIVLVLVVLYCTCIHVLYILVNRTLHKHDRI